MTQRGSIIAVIAFLSTECACTLAPCVLDAHRPNPVAESAALLLSAPAALYTLSRMSRAPVGPWYLWPVFMFSTAFSIVSLNALRDHLSNRS
jgi:hypothetical protein